MRACRIQENLTFETSPTGRESARAGASASSASAGPKAFSRLLDRFGARALSQRNADENAC